MVTSLSTGKELLKFVEPTKSRYTVIEPYFGTGMIKRITFTGLEARIIFV
jgi:hypothetical protein